MLNKPFFRHALSPLATLLTLLAIHLASRFEWFTVSLAFPVGVLAICLFWSGMRANILSAILVSVYALYSSHFDLSRTGQVIFVAGSVAIVGGGLRRWLVSSIREEERQRLRAAENQSKADFVDNLDGNTETIKEINGELIDLTNALPVLDKTQIRNELNRIQNRAANLAQRVVGWRQLALAKKEVIGDE